MYNPKSLRVSDNGRIGKKKHLFIKRYSGLGICRLAFVFCRSFIFAYGGMLLGNRHSRLYMGENGGQGRQTDFHLRRKDTGRSYHCDSNCRDCLFLPRDNQGIA